MTPKKFVNHDLNRGDKVRLTLSGGKKIDCFFGGYKTFGLIEPNLDTILPVFYAPTKHGKMSRISALGKDHFSEISYSIIKKIDKLNYA